MGCHYVDENGKHCPIKPKHGAQYCSQHGKIMAKRLAQAAAADNIVKDKIFGVVGAQPLSSTKKEIFNMDDYAEFSKGL